MDTDKMNYDVESLRKRFHADPGLWKATKSFLEYDSKSHTHSVYVLEGLLGIGRCDSVESQAAMARHLDLSPSRIGQIKNKAFRMVNYFLSVYVDGQGLKPSEALEASIETSMNRELESILNNISYYLEDENSITLENINKIIESVNNNPFWIFESVSDKRKIKQKRYHEIWLLLDERVGDIGTAFDKNVKKFLKKWPIEKWLVRQRSADSDHIILKKVRELTKRLDNRMKEKVSSELRSAIKSLQKAIRSLE